MKEDRVGFIGFYVFVLVGWISRKLLGMYSSESI